MHFVVCIIFAIEHVGSIITAILASALVSSIFIHTLLLYMHHSAGNLHAIARRNVCSLASDKPKIHFLQPLSPGLMASPPMNPFTYASPRNI